MLRAGCEPIISGGERPQTYILDRAATGTSTRGVIFLWIDWNWKILWNGNDIRKVQVNEDLRKTMPSTDYNVPKISEDFGML